MTSKESTKKVYVKLSVEELTFDEMIAIQEGNLRQAKSILVKFATDENGKALPEAVANEEIGQLTLTQMRELFAEFGSQVQTEMAETLPNGRGRR